MRPWRYTTPPKKVLTALERVFEADVIHVKAAVPSKAVAVYRDLPGVLAAVMTTYAARRRAGVETAVTPSGSINPRALEDIANCADLQGAE